MSLPSSSAGLSKEWTANLLLSVAHSLFSSLGGTLGKDDYDDLESLSVELKDHGSHAQGVQQPSSKNSIERKVGEDSVSTPAAWPLQEHVQKPVRSKSRTQPPPPPSQAQDGNVILKTVSLDVR